MLFRDELFYDDTQNRCQAFSDGLRCNFSADNHIRNRFLIGVISRGTRDNAAPIVEKLPERMGTAVPLLKCLRTPKCSILQDFSITISIFSGNHTPGLPQKRPRCLDPDTNFRLACQRCHCSCFTKRPEMCSSTDCSRPRPRPSPSKIATVVLHRITCLHTTEIGELNS